MVQHKHLYVGHSPDKYFQITREHTLPAAYTCILFTISLHSLRGNYGQVQIQVGNNKVPESSRWMSKKSNLSGAERQVKESVATRVYASEFMCTYFPTSVHSCRMYKYRPSLGQE